MSEPNTEKKVVIGLDLGHGDTALALVATKPHAAVITGEIGNRKVQATAMRRRFTNPNDPDDYTVDIGHAVFNRVRPEDDVHLLFKKKPDGDPENRRVMREFYEAVLTRFDPSFNARETIVIVGCPSSWTEREREDYAALFDGTAKGYPVPTIVPESRAAVVYAHLRTSHVLSLEQLESGAILVVDVGSSTTDFTLVQGLKADRPLRDFGLNIGGGDFDEAIYQHTLDTLTDDNGDSVSEHAKEILADPRNHNRVATLKYRCRQQKEHYFADWKDFEEEGPDLVSDTIGTIRFVPQVNGRLMAEFLRKPLPGKNKSWLQTFDESLQGVARLVPEEKVPLKAILLTGGASRMHFVEERIDALLASKTGVTIVHDTEREHSVARGLALWGRQRYLIDAFRREMREAFDEEMPTLLERHLGALLERLLPDLVSRTVKSYAIPALREWRDGEIETTADLHQRIKSGLDGWLKSPDGASFLAGKTNDWWDGGPQAEFRALIDPICLRYGLPEGAVDLRVPFDAKDFVTNVDVPIPLEGLLRIFAYIVVWAILVALPIIGPIIGGILVLIFKSAIDEALEELLKDAEVPKTLRGMVSDEKIDGLTEEDKLTEMTKKSKDKLLDQAEALDTMRASLLTDLRNEIDQRAQTAARLIRFSDRDSEGV